MVEADSHLKLIPTSILHIYKVFEHLDMLSIGIQQQPNTVLRTLIGSDFGVRVYLWSQHDVITSWLMLRFTLNCFPHPYYTYTKCLSTLICCPLAYTYSKSLTQLYRSYFGVLGHLWSQHDVNTLWLRLRVTSNCFPHPH